jgi:serine/threonine protein kinase
MSGALFEFLRDPDDYTVGQLLGKGACASVSRAQHRDGTQVALKQAREPLRQGDVAAQRMFIREVSILARLKTRLCLPLLGFWVPPDGCPVILTPVMEHGTLGHVIEDDAGPGRRRRTPTEVMKIAYGLAFGMRICHSYNIVHRDLKPDNVFMNENFEPVIADFGLSKCLTGSVQLSVACGTPLFMAPEMHEGVSTDKPIDVYAYAMILYCLIGRVTPSAIVFEGQKKPTANRFSLERLVVDGTRPWRLDRIPEAWQRIIDACWVPSPRARLTFDQIVAILEDDRELILEGADEAEYRRYIDECNAEVTAGEAMPAVLMRSYPGQSDLGAENIVEVAGEAPPAPQPPPAPAAPGGTRRRSRQGSFDWN